VDFSARRYLTREIRVTRKRVFCNDNEE
jgi:hypothetical protein